MWSTHVALLVLLLSGEILSKSLPDRNSSVLISEYAKVAHWGSARSSQGQKPWTQRSEGSISYGQNLKTHRAYDTSQVPAIGEVEDRFNPKPYFVYGNAEDQKGPIETQPVKAPPTSNYDSPVYLPTPTPTEDIPVPALPSTEPKPHEDPYDSPYSSYNPPPKKNVPEDSYSPQIQSDLSPMDDSYGTDHHEAEDYSSHPHSSKVRGPPVEESYFSEPNDFGHSDETNGVIVDHPPHGYSQKSPPMAPPPDQFPHYLYDDHSDHHVYHEVEKPKEQKRVSKPQYSYYYIGRKLWYIPLYFSVYFIIYVTFLILKSIARHKIQFKHDLEDHHSRESRQLGSSRNEVLDNIHRNVTAAIEKGKRSFPLVVM